MAVFLPLSGVLIAGLSPWSGSPRRHGSRLRWPAFLVGLTLSGSVAERGQEMPSPRRDVFGGLFFVFFGLRIDPSDLPPVLGPALGLAVVTKAAFGWWTAARLGIGVRGRMRTALLLVLHRHCRSSATGTG